MSLDRLNRGEAIATASAVVLFVSMFLDWYGYGYEQQGNLLGYLNLFVSNTNAWEALHVISLVLVTTITVTLGAGLLALFDSEWKPAVAPSAAVSVLGGLSFLSVLFRIISPPGLEGTSVTFHGEPRFGIYLGLLAAAGISCGGYAAMRGRGTSFAKVAAALADKPAKRSEKRPEPRI